jgi:putative ABC transport system ATP-binding protein
MIEIIDLVVRFNAGLPTETTPLRGLGLQIDAGGFVTVIGSNGAGKSTLLNCISGDVPAASGRIVIDGVDVTSMSAAARAEYIARVFQDPLVGTCEELTVEENLGLAAARGRKRGLRPALDASMRARFATALAELGLGIERKLRDPLASLSGGQRQVVSLLMATLAPSRLLLLDEHTAALDPKTAAFVIAMSERIARQSRLTVLMVTHSMQQALDVGDRTVMLHGGRIILDVQGEERRGLTVKDLLQQFERTQGTALADDALILESRSG